MFDADEVEWEDAGSHKVKSLSPNHRFVIALHSPCGVVETGLPMCATEKKARNLASGAKRGAFSGPD
jgi:hypothetical protein